MVLLAVLAGVSARSGRSPRPLWPLLVGGLRVARHAPSASCGPLRPRSRAACIQPRQADAPLPSTAHAATGLGDAGRERLAEHRHR